MCQKDGDREKFTFNMLMKNDHTFSLPDISHISQRSVTMGYSNALNNKKQEKNPTFLFTQKPCSTSNIVHFQEHRTNNEVQAGAPATPAFSLKLATVF